MTVITSTKGYDLTEYKEFNSNTNININRPILWNRINLNNSNTRHILSLLVNDEVDNAPILTFLRRRFSLNTDFRFLFLLTTIGRCTLNFIQFCKLVGIFSSINEVYRRKYQAARMFKNMICHTSSGKNFPIQCPEDLVYKLHTFNLLANQGTITYFDILDCASDDIRKGKIKAGEYVNIIYVIMKAAYKSFGLRSFEREICKKALNVFQILKNKKYSAAFQTILYRTKKTH